MPRRSKASAAVNPPMPPPITTTFLDALMAYPTLDVFWIGGQASLAFHAGGFDHRSPTRNFRRNEAGEILRRTYSCLKAEPLHARRHCGRLKLLVDHGVELFHDVGRRASRCPQSGP